MNQLHQKINLLKDIQVQFNSSLESVEVVKENCQAFLNHIQYEFNHRGQEKTKFITKIGRQLREDVLEGYGLLLKEFNLIYARHESNYHMIFQQLQTLTQTIEQIDPIYRQLLALSVFTHGKQQKSQKLKEKMQQEEAHINNTRQFKEVLLNKEYEYVHRQQRKKKKVICESGQNKNKMMWLKMEKVQNERLIQLGKNIEERQREGLNRIMDNWLGQILKVNILNASKRISSSSMFPKSPISISNTNINQEAHNNLLIYSNQPSPDSFSLQIQSQKSSLVDLTCYEQIQMTFERNRLQQIIQKGEEEQIQSNQSHKCFINIDVCDDKASDQS